jgi:hypothetical protein
MNWTMGEISVIAVRPHKSRNDVSTEQIAIPSGTRARNEPNTKTSTISAPTPPMTASSSTPGPSSASPEESNSAS